MYQSFHFSLQCSKQVAPQILYILSFFAIFRNVGQIVCRHFRSFGYFHIGNWRATGADTAVVGIYLVYFNIDVIHWTISSKRKSYQRYEKICHWLSSYRFVAAFILHNFLFLGCYRLYVLKWWDWHWRHGDLCVAGKHINKIHWPVAEFNFLILSLILFVAGQTIRIDLVCICYCCITSARHVHILCMESYSSLAITKCCTKATIDSIIYECKQHKAYKHTNTQKEMK